jgi:hypothetical protein
MNQNLRPPNQPYRSQQTANPVLNPEIAKALVAASSSPAAPSTPAAPATPAVEQPAAAPATAVQVTAGAQLPPSSASVPKLAAQQALPADATAADYSAIAHGITFEGNATLRGGCMIGGNVVGNFSQAQGTEIHITVAETGTFRGDIKAQQIVVMGHTHGLLDAHPA